LKLGYDVFPSVRKQADADALKAEAGAAADRLHPLIFDVQQHERIPEAVSQVTASLKEKGLPLAAVVNNAGIVYTGPFEFSDITMIRRQFEVNTIGSHMVSLGFLPLLRASRGRLINLSSLTCRISFPMMSAYAATKAQTESLADTMRNELNSQGVAVIIVCPGKLSCLQWSLRLTVVPCILHDRPRSHADC
jgi:short-subunit dehydrogenase